MNTNKQYKYYAFISYKREDEEWAKWLQYEFEHYMLPSTLNGKENLPQNFRPIFRDVDELSAGCLPDQIYGALSQSKNLIVVCSPRSAKSEWVNKEITDFIEIGRDKGVNNIENIFPLIVEGIPHSKNPDEECFPKALRELVGKEERIGGNINESGRDKAFVKTVAGTLRIGFDELWNRYELEKIEEEKRIREERNRLQIMQSRFLAEKSIKLVEEEDYYLARLLALVALPKHLDDRDDRPYCAEAELALRLSCSKENAVLKSGFFSDIFLSETEDSILAVDYDNDLLHVFDFKTGAKKGIAPLNNMTLPFTTAENILLSENEDFLEIKNEDTGLRMEDIGFLKGKIYQHPGLIDEWDYSMVLTAFVSCDGRYILTADIAGNIILWNGESRKKLRSLAKSERYVHSVALTNDCKYCVWTSEDDTIRIKDIEDCEWNKMLNCECFSINTKFISNDESFVLTFTKKHYPLLVMLPNMKTMRLLNFKCQKEAKFAISSDSTIGAFALDDNSIYLWNIKENKIIWRFVGHTDTVESLSFDSDEHLLLSSSSDGTVRVWDVREGTLSLLIQNPDFNYIGAKITPDNQNILLLSSDRIEVLNISSGKSLHTFNLDIGSFPVQSLYFNKEGNKFLVKTAKEMLVVCDFIKGSVIFRREEQPVMCAEFSPIEDIVVFDSYKEILFHDLKTNSVIKTIKGHDNTIVGLDFSPDGEYLLSASFDRTIRVWNVNSGCEVQRFKTEEEINIPHFSRNLNYIESISGDNKLYLWKWSPLQDLIDETRERFKNRKLTPEERKKYYLE